MQHLQQEISLRKNSRKKLKNKFIALGDKFNLEMECIVVTVLELTNQFCKCELEMFWNRNDYAIRSGISSFEFSWTLSMTQMELIVNTGSLNYEILTEEINVLFME